MGKRGDGGAQASPLAAGRRNNARRFSSGSHWWGHWWLGFPFPPSPSPIPLGRHAAGRHEQPARGADEGPHCAFVSSGLRGGAPGCMSTTRRDRHGEGGGGARRAWDGKRRCRARGWSRRHASGGARRGGGAPVGRRPRQQSPPRPPRHDRRRGRPPRAAAAILEGGVKRGGTAPRRRDVLPQHPWIGPDACPRAAVLPPTARVEVSGGSVR